MGFELQEFIKLRPYVYHLTSRDNLRRFKLTGRMDTRGRVAPDGGAD